MNEIRLADWPQVNGDYALSELYRNVDQQYCLMRLPQPLPYPATARYLQGIYTGIIDDKPFAARAVYLDGQLIGKIECTAYPNGFGELDIVLHQAYAGRHIGRKVLAMYIKRLKEISFCTDLCAYVDLENEAAIAILAANGFAAVSRFQAEVTITENGMVRLETRQGLEFHKTLKG